MPAAAVIPAPEAYIKVVAVKKLVVGFLVGRAGPPPLGGECRRVPSILPDCRVYRSFGRARLRSGSFTVKKLECLKQAYAVNTLAWNNKIGLLPILLVSGSK